MEIKEEPIESIVKIEEQVFQTVTSPDDALPYVFLQE